MAEAEARDERGDLGALVRGEARRFARDAEGALAQFFRGDVREVGAIDAAGKGDQHIAHLAQQRAQSALLLRSLFGGTGFFGARSRFNASRFFFDRQTVQCLSRAALARAAPRSARRPLSGIRETG